MSTYFFDSSALVKRYALETGSQWVTALTDSGSVHVILIGEITLVEVAAALAAKARMPGGLSPAERDGALSSFLQDCRDRYMVVGADRNVIDLAVDVTQRHVLRAYDALQLATGLLSNTDLTTRGIEPLVFISSDRHLLPCTLHLQ